MRIDIEILEPSFTNQADEGKDLPPHPRGTVEEPDSELAGEAQTQITGTT